MNTRGSYWIAVANLLLVCASAPAQVQLSQSSVDLGEIRGGRPLTKEFSFTNTSSEMLRVTEVRPGCGCLAVRLSKTEVAPGEKGIVEIDLRTLGQSAGPHTWTAHLRYRCGDIEGEVPLRISAHVVNDIQLQPASLSLIAQGPMKQELTLIDTRARPLRVESVHTSSAFLKAKVVNQSKTPEGHRLIKLALDLTADCPLGQHSETLAIHTTDPEYRRLVVPVAVTMSSRARLYAQPSALDVTASRQGPVLSKFIRVVCAQPGPVMIDKVGVDHPAVTCTWVRGPESAATLRVRIDPTRIDDSLETTLRVQVASPQREILHIPLRVRCE